MNEEILNPYTISEKLLLGKWSVTARCVVK